MMTYQVEQVDLVAQKTAVVRGHVALHDIAEFIQRALGEIFRVLNEQGLTPVGPAFGRYALTEDGFDAEVGFPASGEVQPAGRVVASELPGGPVAQVMHKGDYAEIGPAYGAASGWVSAHGYTASGPPWESYLDGPEVPEPRTVVSLPFRR